MGLILQKLERKVKNGINRCDYPSPKGRSDTKFLPSKSISDRSRNLQSFGLTFLEADFRGCQIKSKLNFFSKIQKAFTVEFMFMFDFSFFLGQFFLFISAQKMYVRYVMKM